MPHKVNLTTQSKQLYFTSDLHFYHKNIIKYENRPFSSLEEMNKSLIENWNSIVPKNGIVVVCGDFCWKKKKINEVEQKLNGYKLFLKGNHDNGEQTMDWPDISEITINDKLIVCSHYPMLSWNRSYSGSYHLFGHIHSKKVIDINLRAMNVGTDLHDYKPISFEFVNEVLSKKPKHYM